MNFHDIEQNTEEWLQLRAGLVTSSKMATIMAHFGKDFGEPAKAYAQQIALERFLGERVETNSYKSKVMDRGHELEPIARGLYEREMMVAVKNGGFFEDGKRGDSPDGLVGSDGILEIKSVEQTAHWKLIKNGGYDLSYKWQIQNHIWVPDRKWCDFASYCPDFPPEKQLYIFRVERDEDMIHKMMIRLGQFEELVKENLSYLNS